MSDWFIEEINLFYSWIGWKWQGQAWNQNTLMGIVDCGVDRMTQCISMVSYSTVGGGHTSWEQFIWDRSIQSDDNADNDGWSSVEVVEKQYRIIWSFPGMNKENLKIKN